ncbi:MAG: hypothetical protein LBL90_09470 [Prevotellaceae bacterium]|nr:hypothetical protein [Prevotellaceae bacterium]
MKILNILLIISILCVSHLSVFSQELTLKIALKDADNMPVEGAVTNVLRALDSTRLTYAVTDKQGILELTIPQNVRVSIAIRHVSFTDIDTTVVLSQNTEMTFFLKDKYANLSEVVVVSQRKAITFQDGNLKVNINRIPNVENESAAEIISKLPGVLLTDNQITLNAQSVTVQINGVDQKMALSNVISLLHSMPASSIETVDLISNKTAEQSIASGAIINIRIKNRGFDGYQARLFTGFRVYPGDNPGGGAGAFFMLKQKRFTFNGTYNYANNLTKYFAHDSTRYIDNTYFAKHVENSDRGQSNYIDLNASFELSKKQNIGLSFSVYDEHKKFTKEEYGVFQSAPLSTKGAGKGHDDLWSLNVRYGLKDSAKYEFATSYGLMWGGIRANTTYIQDDTSDDMLQNSTMNGLQHEGKLDFKWQMIPKLRLGVGSKLNIGKLTDYTEYIPDMYETSDFTANENVLAFTCHYGISYPRRFPYTLDSELNTQIIIST